jgi:hypothetical protein
MKQSSFLFFIIKKKRKRKKEDKRHKSLHYKLIYQASHILIELGLSITLFWHNRSHITSKVIFLFLNCY